MSGSSAGAEPPDAPDHTQGGLSPAQLIAIARAYWKLSAVIWLCVTVVAAVAIKFMPKSYTAMASLIVDTNNKDPLAGEDFPIALLNNYVFTQVELMHSPVVLAPVVSRLNLVRDPEFTAGFRGDPNGLLDYVENSLSKSLQIDQGRGGQLLYVAASARQPTRAADIANAVVDAYLDEERRRINGPAGERAKRYGEQLTELRAKVAAAQENVATFRKQQGLTEVTAVPDPDNPDADTQELNNLEQNLLTAQNARRALEARLAGEPSTSDEALQSPQIQQLQTRLQTLQSQLAEYSASYGPQHPKVLVIKSQIETTQQSLSAEIRNLRENTGTQLSRAKALEDNYSRAVDSQRAKVLHLREIQGEGAKLILELESAQSVYKRALDGYDQIMFAAVGNYNNVSVVSLATPPVTATKPNKIKLLLMGMVAGLGVGIGGPLVYGLLFNRRLRCRDDIERSFGIPVLAQFGPSPELSGPA
jgi:uncharacterized protein involved in exopolysaccharide biosynthesis